MGSIKFNGRKFLLKIAVTYLRYCKVNKGESYV